MAPAGEITADDVADFLEQGWLDHLVPLFRSDADLYRHLPALLGREAIAVRLGAAALVETLVEEDPKRRGVMARTLAPLLGDERPTLRGDAAYLLGAVGHLAVAAPLRILAAGDPDADVREIAGEALERIAPGAVFPGARRSAPE